MNEDEAFIRAIVDNRGDDTSRLVYADWLDDRSDLRGPYLRAEYEWVKSGKKEKALRAMAAALDPVWVAHISRPPVGVCLDTIRFDTMPRVPPGPRLTPADHEAFETERNCKLPAAYRAFLMNWNGGCPYPNQLPDPVAPDDLIDIESFGTVIPIGEDGDDLLPGSEVDASVDNDHHGRLLWIATYREYGGLFLSLSGRCVGQVYWNRDVVHGDFGDLERNEFDLVAKSLPELFPLFLTTDPEWKQYIVRNEVENLRTWLDAGGDLSATYSDHGEWRLLEYALYCNRPAIMKLLLDRGAQVTLREWQVARQCDDAEVRSLIMAASPKKPPKPGKPGKGRKKR